MDSTIQAGYQHEKGQGHTFNPGLGSPKTSFRVPLSKQSPTWCIRVRATKPSAHKPACFASAEAHLSVFVHPRPVPHDAPPGASTLKCPMIRISRSQPHLRQSDPALFTVFVCACQVEVRYEPAAGQNHRIFKALLPSTIPRPSHMLCPLDLPVGAGQLALNDSQCFKRS